MSGRPVHLFAAAAVAAAASLFSISDASAGCCGGGYHQAPVAYYTAPVVHRYSYAAPATYASGCGCGGGGLFGSYGNGNGAGYAYAARPMYAVNQGPAFTDPVINAEPTPAYDEGYGYRRSYGYRGYGARIGYRGYGLRGYGLRGYGRFGMQRHRYGAVVPGRIGMRHMGYGMQRHMHRPHMPHAGQRMHMRPMPGMVHPK
jgi:hypothetical protein